MAILPAHIAKITIGSTDIPNHSFTIRKTKNVAKVHNARDGVKRIATLADASGSFDAFFDDTNPPDVLFAEGATVTAKFYVDATHFYTGSIIIDPLEITPPAVEGEGIRVRADWALASGTLTAPSFS